MALPWQPTTQKAGTCVSLPTKEPPPRQEGLIAGFVIRQVIRDGAAAVRRFQSARPRPMVRTSREPTAPSVLPHAGLRLEAGPRVKAPN